MTQVPSKKGSSIAVTKGKSTGTSMGGMFETTKGYAKRRAARIKAENEYYASMCGPVTVRKIGE